MDMQPIDEEFQTRGPQIPFVCPPPRLYSNCTAKCVPDKRRNFFYLKVFVTGMKVQNDLLFLLYSNMGT